jgi:outer membrane lipoprotein-sorting protein
VFHWIVRTAAVAAVIGLSLGIPAVGAVTPNDRPEIGKAEEYLNNVRTLKARFLQIGPDGSTAEGTVYLSRPGRMRLEYDPPSPILVVADGGWLIYYDSKLGQVSYLGLDSTPAGILVKPDVKLDGEDLKVTGISHKPGVMNLTVIRRKDPGEGQITMVFSEAPFQLRQWQVVDAQGQATTVSLYDAQTGMALDRELFHFVDPRNGVGPDLSGKNMK